MFLLDNVGQKRPRKNKIVIKKKEFGYKFKKLSNKFIRLPNIRLLRVRRTGLRQTCPSPRELNKVFRSVNVILSGVNPNFIKL